MAKPTVYPQGDPKSPWCHLQIPDLEGDGETECGKAKRVQNGVLVCDDCDKPRAMIAPPETESAS